MWNWHKFDSILWWFIPIWVKSILGSELFGIFWKILLAIHTIATARPIVHCLAFLKVSLLPIPFALVCASSYQEKSIRNVQHPFGTDAFLANTLELNLSIVSFKCMRHVSIQNTKKWRSKTNRRKDPTVRFSIVFWNLMCLIFGENPDAET